MQKNVLVAAVTTLIALGLSGCESYPILTGTRDARHPKLSVVSGRFLVVDQEPIVVPKGEKDFPITWELPRGSSFTFPKDGIVIAKAGDEFQCRLEEGLQRFTCIFRNSHPGRYKYTIKALDRGEPLPPLDPIIMNDN